ncbi:vWA domain-containing protein [Roseovarius sp.]|jgi:hypothetical protein
MMKHFIGAITIATAALTAQTSYAVTNTQADVVFIVDESGSMAGEQDFLANTITSLNSALGSANVTDVKYGVIGFGGSTTTGGLYDAPRLVTGLTTVDAAKTGIESLITSGGFEDGYDAIKFAFDNLSFRAGAARNFILVTDENRDDTPGSTNTMSSIASLLSSTKTVLNAILNVSSIVDGNGNTTGVIGINNNNDAYTADGSGDFFTTALGTLNSSSNSLDYDSLALNSGGAVWNLNVLRQANDTNKWNDSFSSAFIDIKVQEITTQPPSGQIPLPAGGWLLLTGLGGLAALRRKRRAA